MPVDMFGMISHRLASEIIAPRGPVFDGNFIRDFARAHEQGGFDRVLVGYYSNAPDGFLVAAHAAASTERLGILLAHRPGFVAPTVAARKLATLDQLSGGRLALHVISGGSDVDQRKDGDFTGHDERYRRTEEYLDVLKRVWTADGPIDHHGEVYRFEGAYSEVRTVQQPHLPIFFGGASDAAVAVGAKHADVYMLWGEPLADVRATIAKVRNAAASHGRTIRFSVSFRPILGPTEDQAWARAHDILAQIGVNRDVPPVRPQSVGSQRLLAAAARGEVFDRCLWTPIAAATGARGNTTALVGTPETVADAILDYYDLGVTTILIRGFDPLNDAVQYGRALLPLVHAKVAARDAAANLAVAVGGTAMTDAVRIVAVVGNPRAGSRTRLAAEAVVAGIARLAESAGRSVETSTIDLADLACELFSYPSATVDAALESVRAATVLVVASPTYKATYTGLLKVFLDRLPGGGLDGVVAVPMMLGGAPNHLLAVDVHLRPVLLELGATCSTRGLFVQESELDALDAVVEHWCAGSRASLLAAVRAD